MNSTPEEAATELALTPVQERLDLTEAVLLVLRGANVRQFNNSRSSFKKGGQQKPPSVFMRIAAKDVAKRHVDPDEWILRWQEKHGVVLSVHDELFDADFQGSWWA